MSVFKEAYKRTKEKMKVVINSLHHYRWGLFEELEFCTSCETLSKYEDKLFDDGCPKCGSKKISLVYGRWMVRCRWDGSNKIIILPYEYKGGFLVLFTIVHWKDYFHER